MSSTDNTNYTIKSLNIKFTDTFIFNKSPLLGITIDKNDSVVLHTINVNKPYQIITKYDIRSFYLELAQNKLWANNCKIVIMDKPFDIIFEYKDLSSLIDFIDINFPMYLI